MSRPLRIVLGCIPIVALVLLLPIAESPSTSGNTYTRACVTTFPLQGVHPGGLATGPDRRLWFTAQLEDKVGYFNPRTRTVRTFALPKGTQPHFMSSGIEGKLWFSGLSGHIGTIDPRTGRITLISRGITRGGAPHAIIPGPDGKMYFSEQEGGRLGEYDPQTGQITEYTKGLPPRNRMHGMTVDPDRRHLWLALQGADALARFNLATHAVDKLVRLPKHSGPHDIHAVGGALQFTMQNGSKIGRYDLRTGEKVLFDTFVPVPKVPDLVPAPKLVDIVESPHHGGAFVSSFALGRLLHVDFAGKRIRVVGCGIPKRASTLEVTVGPDGHLWFSDPLGGRLARVDER